LESRRRTPSGGSYRRARTWYSLIPLATVRIAAAAYREPRTE
jgi:hypothetical protein